MNAEQCVRLLYLHMLGREPDELGLRHWTAQAEARGLGAVMEDMVSSKEYTERARAAQAPQMPAALVAACIATLGRDLTIIDVGAQKLNFEDHVYAPLLAAGAYKIIGFEPLAARRKERLNSEGNARLDLLPDLVGDGSERQFHINNADSTSSLLPLNAAFNKDFPDLASLQTERVERVKTERLDTLLAAVGTVDFLKFDIQGFELEALRGAEETLKRTSIVHSEVLFAPIYVGQASFHDIDAFLRARDFELIDLVNLNRIAYATPSGAKSGDRLIWGEAVFFRRPAASDCLVQALAAWMIYGKVAFAQHLLHRHDAMTGSALSALLQ
jgi:FkbM family methyltransferase